MVQIFGYSEDDFEEMKNAFTEIARDIETSYSNSDLTSIFDDYIGKEDGIDGKGNIYRYIFSAPNEYEEFWRVDIYVIVNKDSATEDDNTDESTEDSSIPNEYKSALKKAKVYSDTMHMSKAAIHDQLTSEYGENFSEEAADYAMENLVADYKENALKKAEDYNEMMYMSKAGIYEQLTSEYGERFTDEEAQYAVDTLVADYKKNALKKAKDYQEMMDMSPSAIYDQLVSDYGEKFTDEEAQYAIDNLE
ncbi:MAG: Ltp family lipoprotein [Eubacterium sp.]|nr:Ltp family lipoprotein [Eubacterium sp.]